ncbi:MAG: glycosyltransferase [Clostridia bacterium]|nr:glycosyltransferase [Clostridia bacterium]
MKICDCVKDAVWYDPRVRKQIDEYIRAGHTVEAVGVKEPRYDEGEVEKVPCRVSLAGIDDKYYNKPNLFQKIYREIKTNVDMYHLIMSTKPDVIHANDLNALVPAYRAAKKLKCGIIYDTHEIFLENPWMVRNKIGKLIWSVIEKRLIRRVDLVVSVSHAAADYLKKEYRLDRIMVVTNCVDSSAAVFGNTPAAPLQILNHGQFYEGRGYDILVDVAPLIADKKDLQIVLRGFGRLEKELREKVSENGITNLIFAPPVKVYELISAASVAWVGVAITESISLNFELSVSNKLFEYAAAGLPVIMSDIPEHRYLNEKYHFGVILKSNSPQDIAEAINKLYYDRDFYNSCRKNAYRLTSEVNWQTEFKKLMDFEASVVGKNKN